jgi:hypothetical protein
MTRTAVALILLGAAMATANDRAQDDAVALAKKTLAAELESAAADAELEKVEAVEWPDTSLGCPEKGKMYAQMITPGYRVLLKANGRTHEVHVGGSRAVICNAQGASGRDRAPQGAPGAQGSPGTQPMIGAAAKAYEIARKDLAARLKVPESAIKAGSVRPQTWPDAGLGCAKKGEVYEAGEVQGFVILLENAGKTYEYHGDAASVRLCS